QFDKQEDKELRYVPRKDQGTRAAGTAISPMFLSFFLLQGLCGFVAAITALKWSWAEPANRIHRVRATLLLLALGTVIVGWPLEQKVSAWRMERSAAADKILDKYASLADAPDALRTEVREVRADFTTWHLISVLLNMVTVILVTGGMVLAAFLPPARRGPP